MWWHLVPNDCVNDSRWVPIAINVKHRALEGRKDFEDFCRMIADVAWHYDHVECVGLPSADLSECGEVSMNVRHSENFHFAHPALTPHPRIGRPSLNADQHSADFRIAPLHQNRVATDLELLISY